MRRSYKDPLGRLARTAEAFGQGDLSARVNESRNDEIGQLARSFNRMAAQIERSHQQLTAEIAERQQAEEDRQSVEQRFIQFLEGLPLGVFVVDAKGQPYYQNQFSRELRGVEIDPTLSTEQIPERYLNYIVGTDTIYPHDKLPVILALSGQKASCEDMVIRQADRDVVVAVNATPIFGADGSIEYALAAFQDITERKRVEEELREEKSYLASILEMQQQLATAPLDLPILLDLIVKRAQELTKGDGAVIELIDSDELVYRAASGLALPHIGLRLRIRENLSGFCVRHGTPLRCDDTETDERCQPRFLPERWHPLNSRRPLAP